MSRQSRRHFLRTAAAAAVGTGVALAAPSRFIFATRQQAGKQIVLKYTNLWDSVTDTHYQAVHYLFDSFKKVRPDITIQSNFVSFGSGALPGDELKEKADCAAGGCPEIMHDIDATLYTNQYLLNLTPYLNADPGWKAGFDPTSLAFTRTNGFQWGLNPEVNPICMVWNTKILEQAGVGAIPSTWQEFMVAMDKIKRSGKIPATFQYAGPHMFHDILTGLKGGYEALAANKFDAPQVLKAMQLMKTFVDNKWLAPNEIEKTWQTSVADFQAGRLAFYMDGMWSLANAITAKGVPADLRKQVAFSAFPAIDRGTVVEQQVATTIGVAAALAHEPDKLNATLAFLKFWFTPQMAAKWVAFTWSPMGMKLDPRIIPEFPPLPSAWLKAAYSARVMYSLPPTRAMQDQQGNDFLTSMTVLLQGKSAEAALAEYNQYMAKYKKG